MVKRAYSSSFKLLRPLKSVLGPRTDASRLAKEVGADLDAQLWEVGGRASQAQATR